MRIAGYTFVFLVTCDVPTALGAKNRRSGLFRQNRDALSRDIGSFLEGAERGLFPPATDNSGSAEHRSTLRRYS